ncbi:hypothetical protein HELRODRAFT_111318 [Helobdella robusta]|uniref:Ig-like domain-containing protein n=1 Tax=Helobdella robusta TaxID=6412 RepID=T1EFA3_HELRO|nr:hypothetical protein HELRODRAFT_111318 [Helobdella robusta]ESO04845.1 hypothetical protein HELRODRAFT_111318 [Helobdella robusta]
MQTSSQQLDQQIDHHCHIIDGHRAVEQVHQDDLQLAQEHSVVVQQHDGPIIVVSQAVQQQMLQQQLQQQQQQTVEEQFSKLVQSTNTAITTTEQKQETFTQQNLSFEQLDSGLKQTSIIHGDEMSRHIALDDYQFSASSSSAISTTSSSSSTIGDGDEDRECAQALELIHSDDLELLEVVKTHATRYQDEDFQVAVGTSFTSATALMAPIFELPLVDRTVKVGDDVTFVCRVVGTPRPKITWLVDGVEIELSRRRESYEITYEENRCTLVLTKVESRDEGEYAVKAVNEAGSCLTTACLTVISHISTTTATSQGDLVTVETTTTGRKETVSEGRLQEWISSEEGGEVKEHFTAFEVIEEPKKECLAPFFVNKLQANEVLVGSKVLLECEVFGLPVPEITWYKNGVPLTSTEHVTQSKCGDNKCLLTFDCVTPDDQGEYMCKAHNQHGLATTWAELIVESKMSDLLLSSSSSSSSVLSSSSTTKMIKPSQDVVASTRSSLLLKTSPASKLVFVPSSPPSSSASSSNVMANESAATISFLKGLAPSISIGKK